MAGTELLRDDDAEVLQRLYCQYIYVTEGATGSIARVDAETGAITPLAGGLPPSIVGIGRAIDVAFIRGTAYVLVTLVARTWAEAKRRSRVSTFATASSKCEVRFGKLRRRQT